MRITDLKEEDCRELAELDKICFAVPWSEKSFKEELKNPAASYLLAREGEKIVGYCGFWRVFDEAQITNIAVLPEYRKRGIASMLLDRLLEACADLDRIVLEVRKSNIDAIRLYERYGFKKAGERKNFYHSPEENGIIMMRGEI